MRIPLMLLVLSATLSMPAMLHAQEAEAQQEAATLEAAADVADESVADQAASPEEPHPAQAEGLVGAPPPGRGQIVFFREKKFVGAGVRYKVREGDAELGKLSSGTYFIHVAEPGAHEYTVHSEAKDVLHLEVEEGETYYVIGGVTMGLLAGRPNLSPSDEATFQGMSGDLKPAKPLD